MKSKDDKLDEGSDQERESLFFVLGPRSFYREILLEIASAI